MVHLDHLLQPKPIRLRLFSSSQITGSIEEPFAPVKRLRTNWLLGVPRMKRRRIGFSTDTARDKGPNRETDPKQGAKGCSWRYTSLPRGHANIPPSPVRWRYVCVCSPTSQVASSEAYPFPQFKPLLINWLFGKFRLIRRRIDFEHADVRQLGDSNPGGVDELAASGMQTRAGQWTASRQPASFLRIVVSNAGVSALCLADAK